MVRADRNYPAVYFGAPGRLVKLPYPRGGIQKPYERQTFDFVTGSGNHQVSSLVSGSRLFTLNWTALHVDTYTMLDQYRIGGNGSGPWCLIDPSMPNLLPPNVAFATGVYNDSTHYISNEGDQGTQLSNADLAYVHRANGARSIRWYFETAAGTEPWFGASSQYRSWPGHPVVASLPYSFSSWMTPDGTVDSAITVGMRLEWLDAAGSIVSTSTSGDTPITGWSQISVTDVCPAGAVYVRPEWYAVGSTITTGASIYVDEPLLEQDSVVNAWASGTGIKPVEIVGLTDDVSDFASRFRTGVQLVLRELSR